MKQKSFDIALKKGELGEKIIREYLESKGWIVYIPFTKHKAHYFDMLATKNKERAIAIDVKTKARLNKWNAQGIDTRHYRQYMNFLNNHNVPFYLCFIDDKSGDVHVAELTKLSDPIKVNEGIIAWNISQMKLLMNIGQNMIEELSKYDQRNYEYRPINT